MIQYITRLVTLNILVKKIIQIIIYIEIILYINALKWKKKCCHDIHLGNKQKTQNMTRVTW